jgi:hypothetical protein
MLMMVYLFHLYNSGSRRDVIEPMVYLFIYTTPVIRDVIKHHRWFTFSIYAIQTNDFKNPKFLSTSSLPSTRFLSEEE